MASLAVLISGLFVVGCGSSSPGALANGPAVPAGFTAVPGDTTVALSWTANTESNLAGYDVYQGTTSGALTKVTTVAAPAVTHNVTGLTNGTTYYFALRAVDNASSASVLCAEVAVAPFPPDTTPPTVAMTQPSPTTDVALDTAVTLTFSENMNPSTVTATFTPSVTLTNSEWTDGKTLILLPESLTQITAYQVDLVGSDLAGNPLSGTTSFSFTTVNVTPEVLSTSPADMATGVPVTANISFSFSKAMNQTSVQGAFSAVPSITCAWAWSGDSTLATCTHADLSTSTGYTITLSTAATDQAAHPLAANKVFNFATAAAPDTTKPTVSSSTPANSATGASRSTNIAVTFSEPMDKASAQTAFYITSPTGHNAGIFTWNAAGTEMTFNSDTDFAYGDNVSWTVSTAAKDLAGNTMASNYTSTFKVIRQATTTLYSRAALDGYISSTGTVNTSNSGAACGDDSSNLYYRSFLSFDLSSLPTTLTSVDSATLSAYQYLVWNDDPYAHLGGTLLADSVFYGASLTYASAFEVETLHTYQCHVTCCPMKITCGNYDETVTLSDTNTTGWKSVNVQRKVADDWTNRVARGNRSQFRLRFPTNTDADGHYDISDLYTGDATSNKPTLEITYEYP